MRRVRDQYGNNTYEGYGIWTETAQKLATIAAEKIIQKGSEEVGAAVGKKIAKKIEGKPKKGGDKIAAILHQKQKQKPQTFAEKYEKEFI